MNDSFPRSLSIYAGQRETLLARITAGLQADQRFAAAWLSGSIGRGEEDAVSDIDLHVVVTDAHSGELCARAAMTASGSPAARLALIRQFGEPASIHENHHNAPPGGTMTAVLYSQPPVIVDWVLVPHALARRPAQTRLLFDRVGITPLETGMALITQEPQPEGGSGVILDEHANRLAERAAFFWMMAAVTAKYLVRGRVEIVNDLLQMVENTVSDLRALFGTPGAGPSSFDFAALPEQAAQLRRLCDQVEAFGLSNGPRPSVEAILSLLEPPPEQEDEVNQAGRDQDGQQQAE